MLILSKNISSIIPLLKLSVEFKPRELRPFLDVICHVLDMHRHAAARHERRPEEPQENALDESRHKRGRGLASLSRPNRTPKPTRPDANDTHPLWQIAADIVCELAGTNFLMLGLGLDVTRRIEDDVPSVFKSRLYNVAKTTSNCRPLRGAVLAKVWNRDCAKSLEHPRRDDAGVEKRLVPQ